MEDVAIRIENLSYTYTGGERALKDISLEIAGGEYVGIVGANGAGKTTFCLHMNGILPVVLGGRMGGAVWVLGKEPCEQHVYDVAQHVGMVLQDPEAQLFSSDILTEVAFAAENRGVPRDEMVRLIDWALRVVRLSDYADGTAEELSGGQKQRLVIAANLVIRPEILVLDEPTSQLDPIGTSEVFSTLRELNKDFGMTIVVATHKSDQISEYADRIIVLENGSLIFADTPRNVFFQVERLKKGLVHVPEVAELDHRIKQWAKKTRGIAPSNEEANVTFGQAKASLIESMEKGLLQPSPSYQQGLGRSVPEALGDNQAEVILDIRDVSYAYSKGARPALTNVSAQVRRGEVVGMIGQNGAGKTTLMKCIAGLLRPTTGSIEIMGKEVSELGGLESAKLVGLILQNPDNQLFQMSAEEEISFGLKNLALSEEEIKHRVDEALALTGMEQFKEIYPFKLSLGDRRKLAVAAIYAMHPSLLIFDEPTTGQDFQGRYQLCDLAIRLNQMGTTIIMITHDMSLVARYTQRTLVMGRGTLLLDAPTREVFSHREVLQATYLEPPPVVKLAQELESYNIPKDILTVEEMYSALTGEVL